MSPLSEEGAAAATGVRDAVESLRGRRVLVVGDVMLDRTVEGEVDRVSPEAPVPVLRPTRVFARPGGAANVAANVVGLGGEAELIGLAGRDAAAGDLEGELERAGVDATRLVVCERPTTVKTRVIGGRQQIVRIDDEETSPAGAAEAEQLQTAIDAGLGEADAVVLSDYAKGVVTTGIARSTLVQAAELDIPAVVDPKQRDFGRYARAAVLVPNRAEALAAAAFDEPGSIADAGRELLERHEVGAILITLGEDGMMLFEREREPHLMPSRARSVFDVTGAGDTVVATLGLALAAGIGLVEAAELATLAAGIAVEQVLTSVVSPEELQAAAR